ncbi:hypothetical protein [Psychrobacillus vulpis]|uniref:hypothetical protein n=1 Tax=Psychrobacillus vulpis TaxID=2325572 RepID=UPI00140C981B|nr:hypothetical protein [Psychrobacillus vulpis]
MTNGKVSVPTLVIDDEVIQGLASKEKLAGVIERVLEKNKESNLQGMQCNIDGNC